VTLSLVTPLTGASKKNVPSIKGRTLLWSADKMLNKFGNVP